ncbi:MAG: mechanosensitive ion channel family protein, partial [Gammaproteobacteria bacterium]|nr:mechanosensitive ion channel family protein [Gammaproteobacteria bacterium]
MNHSRFHHWIALHPWLIAIVLVMQLGEARAQLPPSAQSTTPAPIALEDPESKVAVREMVAKLSDDAVRALLIQRLDAVAQAKEEAASSQKGALDVLGDAVDVFWINAARSISNIATIPNLLNIFGTSVRDSLGAGGFGQLALVILGAVLLGGAAERVVAFAFRKRKQELIDSFSTTLWGILKILYTRLSFDLLGVLAFAVGSHVVIGYFYAEQTLPNSIGIGVCRVLVAAWLAYVMCRFYFAPRRPDLRICKTTDERAMRLTVSYALAAGYIVFVHRVFYVYLGIGIEKFGGWEGFGPVGFLMNLSIYLCAAGAIWSNRDGLTEILMENKKRVYLAIGEASVEGFSWFATHWPKIAVLLIAAKYFLVEIVVNSTDVAVYSTSAVYITLIVIFLWPGVDATISLLVGKGITTPEDESDAAGKARRGMQQGLLRVGRVLVVCLVVAALAWLWGVNIVGLAEAGLGAKLAGRLVEFLIIALVAYVFMELVSILVGRMIAKEGGSADEKQEEPGGGDAGGVGLSRVATLLPILRRTAQFVIVAVSVIMVLNNWGVNIGPILAGAGVVGLAIGFGAQTLVKDIVSGVFFLADDAFRVGEYIDVGGTMGNVEKISLRSLRLRHHTGLVHTIPYGEIPKLTNFSRDWVIMKLRFRVPFDTDVNRIKKIFKKIGAELLEDPVLGEDFLQPFKSQGVAEVDDNGIVVRGKFMAKPGKQFMIRKEVYVRVQKAFEEADIPFARKQVM